jgi:hypothetical protein
LSDEQPQWAHLAQLPSRWRRSPHCSEQLKRVEQSLDPINVMRDPSANKRIPTGAWNTILSPAEAATLPYSEDL